MNAPLHKYFLLQAVRNVALESLVRGVAKGRFGCTGHFKVQSLLLLSVSQIFLCCLTADSTRPQENKHLLYKSLADIHLDTRVYNAHSTAADVLWAGVPSVTTTAQNGQMVGREGLGMLNAIGLVDTGVISMKGYEDKVMNLF